MDLAIVKNKNEYLAFSINPVGVVGWGNSKSAAISRINDNLYDYCNWLGCKLPKDPEGKVVCEYLGEVDKVKFLQDDPKALKKYCEVAYQTAFSYKCQIDSFNGGEHPLHLALLQTLGASESGIIGFASDLCESGDFAKLRQFIFLTYKVAKEIYFTQKEKGEQLSDPFKFDI